MCAHKIIRRYPEVDPPLVEAGAHLAETLYSRRTRDVEGNERELRAEISRSEGWMLRQLIRDDPSICRIVEVGCAMGVSSMFMASALAGRPGAAHVMIDPEQTRHWKSIGMENMRRSGHDFATFLVEPSELALPRLLAEGQRFDFAFIDGMHTFDHCLLDAFYCNRLVRVGGYIALDDIDANPLNKVVRYLSNYGHLEIVACVGRPHIGRARAALNAGKRVLGALARCLPRRWASEIFDDSVLRPDHTLGLDASLLVFRKTAEDTRPIEWYVRF
jgi:predicted O-methyltransferase YrrM